MSRCNDATVFCCDKRDMRISLSRTKDGAVAMFPSGPIGGWLKADESSTYTQFSQADTQHQVYIILSSSCLSKTYPHPPNLNVTPEHSRSKLNWQPSLSPCLSEVPWPPTYVLLKGCKKVNTMYLKSFPTFQLGRVCCCCCCPSRAKKFGLLCVGCSRHQ